MSESGEMGYRLELRVQTWGDLRALEAYVEAHLGEVRAALKHPEALRRLAVEFL